MSYYDRWYRWIYYIVMIGTTKSIYSIIIISPDVVVLQDLRFYSRMTFRFVENFYIVNIISGMWVKESGREDIIHVVHVNPTISRLSTSTTPTYTAIRLPDNAVSAVCIPLSRSLPMAVISKRVLVRSSSPWYRYNIVSSSYGDICNEYAECFAVKRTRRPLIKTIRAHFSSRKAFYGSRTHGSNTLV